MGNPLTAARTSRQDLSPVEGKFSIVIPVHRDSPSFRKCLEACLALDYEEFEILVVSDRPLDLPSGVRALETGAGLDTGPAVKRDLAIRHATGCYLAFIDDDAFPRQDWLRRARRALDEADVGAVGGPGLTPPGSRFAERVGGAFYESWLGSGPHRLRFRQGRRRNVDDYPAYNLVIRRSAIDEVNGWGTGFYGGEDTVICLALVKAGWRIVYEPELVVYHHRRPLWWPHLRQVGNVGLHRGYFVKAYPETSLRANYFFPTLGTAALAVLLGVSFFSKRARRVLAVGGAGYVGAGFALGLAENDDPAVALALPAVALASHIVYGVQFVRGLVRPKLER